MNQRNLAQALLGVFLGILPFQFSMADSWVQKEELLKGSWVPERREFPLNPAISPCNDLYEHSCGKAIASFKMRPDRSYHAFAFSDSAERLLHAKTQFLKKLTAPQTNEAQLSKRSRELRTLYVACMNADARKKEEFDFVTSEKKRILSFTDRGAFLKMHAESMASPDFSLISFGPAANQDDPTRFDLLMSSELMSLPERSYYEKKEAVKDLEDLFTEFFKTLEMSEPQKRAQRLVDFEKRFAQIHPLPAEIRQRYTQRNTVERSFWEKKYPTLQLQTFLKQIPKNIPSRNLLPETMEFLENEAKSAPLEFLQDLTLYHQLSRVMDDAYPKYFKKEFDFSHKHLGGSPKRPEREERCTRKIMGEFGRELDAELLPILFPHFPEERVVRIAEKVRSSLVDSLTENKWLSASGKKKAIEKMKKATLLLVKPTNDEEWDFNWPGEYSKDRPLQNMRTVSMLGTQKVLKKMSEPRNRRKWLMSPLTVNAYYMPPDNTFVLPIGILQPPFFDETASDQQNIASIGSVVGHELGHGIDDQGSKYDSDGKLKQWMNGDDLKKFSERGQAFVDRFNKIGHNGSLTLGENIGDHVGLSAAFRAAFPEGIQSQKSEAQDFFRQYARVWCYVMRPALKESRLKTDPHALGDARTNEQVKNISGFQEAFSCKKENALYLNEAERIRVW